MTSTHSGWMGTQVMLVSPADQPEQMTNQSSRALETTPSTRAARGGEESEGCWETTRPRAAREESVRKRTRGSARGRANSSSSQRKSLTNQGTTLRRRCEYGDRGAKLTHSQPATPGSEHSSRRQASTKGEKSRPTAGREEHSQQQGKHVQKNKRAHPTAGKSTCKRTLRA